MGAVLGGAAVSLERLTESLCESLHCSPPGDWPVVIRAALAAAGAEAREACARLADAYGKPGCGANLIGREIAAAIRALAQPPG